MLSKCANPDCNNPFRRLRTGRLFQFELGGSKASAAKPVERADNAICIYQSSHEEGFRSIERFWLCAGCAASMSLVRSPQACAVLLVNHSARHQHAAAS